MLMKFSKTQSIILIVMVSVAVFLSVLDVLSTDRQLARQWHYEILATNFYDALTPDQQQWLLELGRQGILTKDMLPELAERFWHAPNRETALKQAFETGFGTGYRTSYCATSKNCMEFHAG